MKAIIAAIIFAAALSGCATIRNNQAADAYQGAIAANQTEYQNGQILLSEKLRRDYLAGIQYGQINKIEAGCTQSYMYLAQKYERGTITEQRFNDRRDGLEMACSRAYASGDESPVSMWRVMGVYSGE